MTSDKGSKLVRNIILERLPPTLLLMGTSNLFLFFGSLFFALSLSRNYGTFWDKAVLALSPTSSAPSWFYGLFFILIFHEHQFRHAQYGIEGCSDLMTHSRQKITLCPICRLGGYLGLAQFAGLPSDLLLEPV